MSAKLCTADILSWAIQVKSVVSGDFDEARKGVRLILSRDRFKELATQNTENWQFKLWKMSFFTVMSLEVKFLSSG